jgi:hypothetical protein
VGKKTEKYISDGQYKTEKNIIKCICVLFNDTVSNSDKTASDDMINELERMWKEVSVA